jgi:ABC-type uncharacterized transport system permease subunit
LDALTLELLNGVSLFAILAIVALGLGIVFGLMGVINLAHGEFVMLGAYVAYVVHASGLNHWLSLPLAAAVLFVLGVVIEVGLIRRIHRQPELTILATFGLSVCLRQIAELVFSKDFQSVPNPVPGATEAFGVLFPTYRYLLIAIVVVVVAATLLAFTRSRFGLVVRAIVPCPDQAHRRVSGRIRLRPGRGGPCRGCPVRPRPAAGSPPRRAGRAQGLDLHPGNTHRSQLRGPQGFHSRTRRHRCEPAARGWSDNRRQDQHP